MRLKCSRPGLLGPQLGAFHVFPRRAAHGILAGQLAVAVRQLIPALPQFLEAGTRLIQFLVTCTHVFLYPPGARPRQAANLGSVELPAPSPEMVAASRRHLTERYASGVDLLLWETERRLIPDLDAIKAVTAAVAAGQADALDVGAAMVLVQAARLGLDHLEHGLFEGARAMGMGSEALAAVLDLPDATAADSRRRWLEARRALPYMAAELERAEASGEGTGKRAARRASRTADRAGAMPGTRARRSGKAAAPGGEAGLQPR